MSDSALPSAFTYRSARSAPFVIGISIAILVETVAVHFLLRIRHPIAAWSVTVLSIMGIAWLVRDYRALGSGAVHVFDRDIHLKIGHRFDVHVPRENIGRVVRPSFRDLPTPGTNEGRDYLNLTKPASPNILILLADPIAVRLPAGQHRMVRRFALHLDDPAGFLGRLGSAAEWVSGSVR